MRRPGVARPRAYARSRRNISSTRLSTHDTAEHLPAPLSPRSPDFTLLHAPHAPNDHAPAHHRFLAQEQVHRPAHDDRSGCWAAYALRNIPLDAIPDLSDVQVIIYTEWPGQAPQIVQDQVTYPITTKMLSVPRNKVVRGYSFYGFSFVYVIFEDGTDPYWARSRVLEYLSGLGCAVARRTSRPRSGRTRPASAGPSCIRSIRPTATWPNCARCRTGISNTSSPR